MEILSVRTVLLSLFLIFLASRVEGQVTPPTIECLKGDTLQWSLPGNACGSFVSTEIYYSSEPQGPFALLATIDIESTTTFVHEVSGIRYYYMQSSYGCSDPLSPPSDTITSTQLGQVDIERVNVREDGAVSVLWYVHPSPRIIAYVIEKTLIEESTTVILDTVFGGLEYIDWTAEADQHPEFYRVWGYDICGNQTSYPNEPHTTIHLRDSLVYCDNLIALRWTNYTGWPSGIERNEYWLGIDGPQAYEHDENGSIEVGGIFLNFRNGSEYCISILSKQEGANVFARSNSICFTANNPIPLSDLRIDNITVSGQTIEVQWTISSDSDLDSLDLVRSDDGVNFQILSDNEFPITDMNLFEDLQASPQEQAYAYEFNAVDACGNVGTSGLARSIQLTVATDDQNNNLISWTPFEITGRDLQSLVLCKISGGTSEEITMPDLNQGSFMESVDPQNDALDACYQLKAIHQDATGADELVATSNLACLEQQVQVYLPTAFVPGGNNAIFRPEFVFADAIVDYRLMVFDRWGALLFESTDPNLGWDGKVNGQIMPPGVFSYLIEVEQTGTGRKVYAREVALLR